MTGVTQGDREAADTICNPIDNPHMHSVLCKKFAAHRIAALEEAAKVADSFEGTAANDRCDDPQGAAATDIADLIRALKGAGA